MQYTDVEVGDGRVVRCVSTGVFLASYGGMPVVVVLSSSERPFGREALRRGDLAHRGGRVGAALQLRTAMREHKVYRRQVISLHGGERGPDQSVRVQFHRLRQIARDAVVLPEGTIDRLERHAIGVANQAQRLRAAGRQLKRGVLLHGPPGTGKR